MPETPATPATPTPATPATPTPATPAAPTTPAKPAAPTVTVDDIVKVCPEADKNNVAKMFPLLAKSMVKKGMLSKNQLVAVVATAYTEMRDWSFSSESGKGGGKYGKFYGRGPLQLTWESNYKAMSKVVGVDLVANPDRALEPELACLIFVEFWCGSTGSPDVRPYAEKGDWRNCRSIINGGSPNVRKLNGLETFNPTIQRGLKIFKSGLDPNSVGAMPMPGNYGLGCVDTNGAPSRTVTAPGPMTQGDALSYALGIHALDNQKSHVLKALLDVHAQPDILKLDAQLTFEMVGAGNDLDGAYTVEEVTFYFGKSMSADLKAYKPDPNASAPQTFLHDANAPATAGEPPAAAATPTTPAAGDIPAKIHAAAVASKGKDTSDGPDGGKNASAFAVNKLVIVPAGLKTLGDPVPPHGVPISVAACEAALKGGRGKLVTREEAMPGDIWVQSGKHMGICTAKGCTQVLSNSVKGKFDRDEKLESANSFYGGAQEKIYRVLN